MANKVGYAILAVLLINVVVAAVFVYLQNEIDTLKPQQPLSSPTPQSTPIPPSTPVNTSVTPPASTSQYSTVTYQWTLKPEYRGNQTWLENVMHGDYDFGKSWSANYVVYIESIWEVPQSVKDTHMTGLVGASFIMHLPVSATYDAQTGHTSVTYEYANNTYYVVESALEHLAVNGDWTTTYT